MKSKQYSSPQNRFTVCFEPTTFSFPICFVLGKSCCYGYNISLLIGFLWFGVEIKFATPSYKRKWKGAGLP